MFFSSVDPQVHELQTALTDLTGQIARLPEPYQQRLSAAIERLAQDLDALLSTISTSDAVPATGYLSIAQSLTEARELTRDAFKANIQMQSVFNNLIAVAILQEQNGIIQMANSYAIALFGFDPLRLSYDVIYHRLIIRDENGEFLSHEDLPTALARQGKVVQNMKLTITNPRGRIYTVLVSSMPMLSGDRITGVVSVWNNITREERLLEERAENAIQMEVQRRLLEHRERERQEIARNIHDGPIQNMVSNLFNLQMTREAIRDSEATSVLNQVVYSIKTSIQELRDVVNELRPPVILHFGLARTIRLHSEDVRAKTPGLSFDLDLMDDEKLLSEDACLALYRIYQESLNNIIRHAHASRAWIRYAVDSHAVTLEIKDNGQGFIVPSDWTDLTQQNHFGIPGIRERVEALGGQMLLASQPGQGTLIRVVVPLSPRIINK